MHIFSKIRRFWRRFVNRQNIVLLVGVIIAFSWLWGAVVALQKNYQLQQRLDQATLDNQLLQLETENMKLRQEFFKSEEYLDLSVRKSLGRVAPGEKLIILPSTPQSDTPVSYSSNSDQLVTDSDQANLAKWIQLFFGGRAEPIKGVDTD